MKTLILAILVTFATFAVSAPGGIYGGHDGGIVVSRPSGVVADHGPIGPAGLGLGGGYGGHGGFGGFGFGGYEAFGGGYGGHGIGIKGPSTVPATIDGPSGKILADGLYGVPSHGW